MKSQSVIIALLIFTGLCNAQINNRNKLITEAEITSVQKKWGDAIVAIGKEFSEQRDYKSLAVRIVDSLYGYDEGTVMFKPTKASQKQFRMTEEEAVSYFVAGIVHEDHGFALQPWTNVRFENSGIIIDNDSAATMGNYYFTDINGNEIKVEFTFGYFKDKNGNLLINLHHSSIPYSAAH